MPDRTIAVLLKGYPRLSETFIAQELRGLEKAGSRPYSSSATGVTVGVAGDALATAAGTSCA